MIYVLYYAWAFIANLFRQGKLAHFLSFGVITILIFGFRYEVGADWRPYERVFYDTSALLFEPGYLWLSAVLRNLTGSFQSLVLVCFFIPYLLYAKSIYEYTPNPHIAFVAWLGISFLAFGLLRNMIAIGVFFYSIRYVEQGSFKKYSFCLLGAALFHVTSLPLILLYPFLKKRYRLRFYVIILAFAAVFLFIDFFTLMSSFFSMIPFIGSKFSFYIKLVGRHKYAQRLGLGLQFYEAFGIFFLALLKRRLLEKKFPKYFNIYLNIIFCHLLAYLFLNSVMVFAVRYIKYFEIGHIILLSYLLFAFKAGWSRKVYHIMAFLYFGLRFFIVLFGVFSQQDNSAVFFPYKNFILESIF